jgi:lipoate-protein ligase A
LSPHKIQFRLIDSPPPRAVSDIAPFNMAVDLAIARMAREGRCPPTIRFYDWGGVPSLSMGSFQKWDGIKTSLLREKKIPAVKRPTGGRAILHGDELTYSISSPYRGPFTGNLFDCYGKISRGFEKALRKLNVPVEVKARKGKAIRGKSAVCFQSTSFAEIGVRGRKLIGSAQKRWTDGFLQQGSIPYSIDRELHEAVFEDYDPDSMIGMKEILNGFEPELFKSFLKESFEDELEAELIPEGFLPEEVRLAMGFLPECRLHPALEE